MDTSRNRMGIWRWEIAAFRYAVFIWFDRMDTYRGRMVIRRGWMDTWRGWMHTWRGGMPVFRGIMVIGAGGALFWGEFFGFCSSHRAHGRSVLQFLATFCRSGLAGVVG